MKNVLIIIASAISICALVFSFAAVHSHNPSRLEEVFEASNKQSRPRPQLDGDAPDAHRMAGAKKASDEYLKIYNARVEEEAKSNPKLEVLLQLKQKYASYQFPVQDEKNKAIGSWIEASPNPVIRNSRMESVRSIDSLLRTISETYDLLEPDLSNALDINGERNKKNLAHALVDHGIDPSLILNRAPEAASQANLRLYEKLDEIAKASAAPPGLFDQRYYDDKINIYLIDRINSAISRHISAETHNYANMAGELMMRAKDPKSQH